MTELALVNPEGLVDRFATNIDPKAATKAGWRWLSVEGTQPSFDAATQVLEGPQLTVGKDAVVRSWSVRAKTSDELASEKDAEISRMGLIAFRVLFNHENRIRALEGKAPITATQFRAALKAD